MQDFDETSCKRYRIVTTFGNNYLIVGDTDLMITVADENQPKHAEVRALVECLCRVASKGLKGELDMPMLVEQMRKADSGRCTLLTQMAGKIEEYLEVGK